MTMLKKHERLSTRQFEERFRTGARLHGDLVQLVYTPGTEFHGAVAVGKKLVKTAVGRNRLRRRIYNALYQLHRDRGLVGTCIILAKPKAVDAPFSALKADLDALVTRTASAR